MLKQAKLKCKGAEKDKISNNILDVLLWYNKHIIRFWLFDWYCTYIFEYYVTEN